MKAITVKGTQILIDYPKTSENVTIIFFQMNTMKSQRKRRAKKTKKKRKRKKRKRRKNSFQKKYAPFICFPDINEFSSLIFTPFQRIKLLKIKSYALFANFNGL